MNIINLEANELVYLNITINYQLKTIFRQFITLWVRY